MIVKILVVLGIIFLACGGFALWCILRVASQISRQEELWADKEEKR